MDTVNVGELVDRLGSDEDSVRKMAAFKLQSLIGDPSFADVFLHEGGLPRLRRLALHATGNTLAYSLSSFSRLLELDQGWDHVTTDLIERAVELVVTQPLVNILRGAMSILAAVVAHPQTRRSAPAGAQFGFRALKPAIAVYPQFMEMLVARLSSADHALCANALHLINALMRDALASQSATSSASGGRHSGSGSGHHGGGREHSRPRRPSGGSGEDWPKFIKRLQDLGVIKSVYGLMQGSALQDLAHPLLEFQALTKLLLRKWRDERVDPERPEHRRALKGLHLASNPPERRPSTKSDLSGHRPGGASRGVSGGTDAAHTTHSGGSRKHHPEKWRRLGFDSEQPAAEFADTGFLGMMDLTDYVRKREEGFARLLLEQAGQPAEARCPVARASLAVTAILYEHFEVDKAEAGGGGGGSSGDGGDGEGHGSARFYAGQLESRSHFEKAFRPLLLQWSRLHTAGLGAFLRLWKATGAALDDFGKVEELARILVEQVVGQAPRAKDVAEVEDEMAEFDCQRLRELQMELLELTYEDVWGHHLRQVRDELNREALQFVKEQRIRCLLQGSWFPHPLSYADRDAGGPVTKQTLSRSVPSGWRYVRLSHNRRWLHYADFATRTPAHTTPPALDALPEKIDLASVSSVVSNVSADTPSTASSSTSTVTDLPPAAANGAAAAPPATSTKITIHGFVADSDAGGRSRRTAAHKPHPSAASAAPSGGPSHRHARSTSGGGPGGPPLHTTGEHLREAPLLTLHPATHTLAAEWLDGLLLLLHQQPLTADTSRLVGLVAGYGLKIRLLNVSFDVESVLLATGGGGDGQGGPVMPGREGVEEEFWYDIGGMEAAG